MRCTRSRTSRSSALPEPLPDTAPLTPAEEADPCHASAKGCGLSVWADGQICVGAVGGCADLDSKHKQDPDSTTCKWGTNEVDWTYCEPLIDSFTAPTQTSTDPDDPSITALWDGRRRGAYLEAVYRFNRTWDAGYCDN